MSGYPRVSQLKWHPFNKARREEIFCLQNKPGQPISGFELLNVGPHLSLNGCALKFVDGVSQGEDEKVSCKLIIFISELRAKNKTHLSRNIIHS